MATETTKILAELEGLGSVSLCPCATIHLAVGAFTIRMAPEAFIQMMAMCRDAMDQISKEIECMPMPVAVPNFVH